MISLLDFAKSFLDGVLPEDGVAADFTMGNGYDTEYLCSRVPKGKVYAFDIQREAIENTAKRLEKGGYRNAVLIHDSHAKVSDYIKQPIHGGMFNLGYRPGGDKTIYTMRESTQKAVIGALGLLAPGGVLVISVYPGHAEGHSEGELLQELLSRLDKRLYCAMHFHLLNSPDAPYIIAVEKYNKNP